MHTVHTFKRLGLFHVAVTIPDKSTSEWVDMWVKYVRREIHTYDDEDRKKLMEAFRIIAETSDAVGIEQYGGNYWSLSRLTTTHNNLAGDKECDHLHDGMGFLPVRYSIHTTVVLFRGTAKKSTIGPKNARLNYGNENYKRFNANHHKQDF